MIETSLADFLIPPAFTQLHPKAVLATYLGWSVRYRIPVFFAGDRRNAQRVTWELLTKYARYATEGVLHG